MNLRSLGCDVRYERDSKGRETCNVGFRSYIAALRIPRTDYLGANQCPSSYIIQFNQIPLQAFRSVAERRLQIPTHIYNNTTDICVTYPFKEQSFYFGNAEYEFVNKLID